jgi:hypothetical protein
MKKFWSGLLSLCFTATIFAGLTNPAKVVQAEESSIVEAQDSNLTATTTEDARQYFKVQGTKILDLNGNEFVIKGANVMGYNAAWPVTALADLELFKTWNFNFARLYTRLDDNYVTGGGPGHNKDLNALYNIIDAYTAEGIVVMIEVHDFTGGYYTDTTTPSLAELANFHASLAERYIDNPYVWFNVMNEPGGSGAVSSQWVTTHQRVIKAIRDTGNNSIIVADGASWGQDVGEWNGNPVKEENSAILKYGADLKNFDGNTYENILFSIHAYDQWSNGDAKLIDYIDRVHAKGHALMIGEFGSWNNSYNFQSLDTVMRVAPSKGVGLTVWHWYGGDRNRLTVRVDGTNGGGQYINRTDGTKPTNLTYLGNLVWDYNHGQLTAQSFNNNLEKDPDAVAALPKPANRIVDDFESYESNEALAAAWINPGHGGTVITTLNGDNKNAGSYSMKLDYTTSSTHAGRRKVINQDWSNYEGISFWLKSDGSGRRLVTQLSVGTINWEYDYILSGTEPQLIEIPFEAFLHPNNMGGNPDVTKVGQLNFYINNNFRDASMPSIEPGSGILYFDDIMLMGSGTEGTRINLIENGGFEDGTSKWDNYGGNSVADPENAYTGVNGLKVLDGNKGGRGRTIADGVLKPNTTYILSAFGKVDGGANADIGFKLKEGANTDYTQYFLHFEEEEEYTYKQLMFTTPAEFNSTKVFIYKNTAAGNLYADNVVLTEVPNLIENGGFEEGTSKWDNYGGNSVADVDNAYTGINGLKVIDGNKGGRGRTLAEGLLKPNTTYILSAFGKVDGGANGDIGIKFKAGADTDYTQLFFHFEGEEEYTYKQLMFTTPAEFNTTKIFIYKNTTAGNMYADNMVLTEVPNLIENGGFEDGTSKWDNYGGNSVADVDNAYSGANGLKVSDGNKGGRGRTLAEGLLKPNTTYILSAFGKVDGGANGDIGIKFKAGSDTDYTQLDFHFEGQEQYTYKQLMFTTPAEFNSTKVFIYKNTAAGSLYADDVLLTEVPSIMLQAKTEEEETPVDPEDLFEVGAMEFKDIEGNIVTALNPSGSIYVEAAVVNKDKVGRTGELIVAVYDANNTMVNYATSGLEMVEANSTVQLTAGFNLPEDVAGHKIKVFVWDSMDTMKPLSQVVLFPNN